MRFGFGQSVPRNEDPRLLTGRGRFIEDMSAPGQAYLVVVRAPHAHADITGIDVAAARTAPGVLAVLTGEDAAADGLRGLQTDDGFKNRDGSESFAPPRPALAQGRVRFAGEPVAIVVAESEDAARDAVDLVDISYEALPCVVAVREAAAEGAPTLWSEAPGNISIDWDIGDAAAVERAFARAAHVVDVELESNRVIGFPMEPIAALGDFDVEEGRYTLHAPSQGVHKVHALIAEVMGIPRHSLRVVSPDVGGGFGVRVSALAEHVLVLWASKRTGRSVKWVATRGETMLVDPHARDHWTCASLALDTDGKMLAVRADTLAALGAHVAPNGRRIPTKSYAAGITGLYAIPHAHLRVRAMFTNTVPTEAYRGAGRPEALYVIERLADLAARKLGITREEIRRRNFIPPSAMPYTTPTVETFDSGEFARNLTDALANADAASIARRKDEARARGKLLGIGLSTYVKINGGSPDEMAEIRFNAGGGVAVIVGTQANGQGHATSFAQLVADRLGVPFESIQLVQGDSDQVPYGNGTGGSSFLSVGGSAVNGAIEKVIESGKRIAGHLLEAAPADLVFAAGRYAIAGTDRSVPMTDVARAAFRAGPWSKETGFGLAERMFYQQKGKTFANGCHVCEVEIDPETGALEVVRYTIVDDVGRVMNPMLVLGQVHGGLAQGLGQALLEHTAYDPESGQLLAGSLMDYCLPRASDFPNLDISFNEIPCTTNPLGVKGVGEAGTTGSMPALVGAAVDALAEYGVTHLDMPLTAERVWRAIHNGKPA